MDTIEKRLQFIIASHQLSASSFADRIGVQRSNVSHVLNGRNKPSFEFILKVIQAFPKVSAHWLMTGEQKVDFNQETKIPTTIVANDIESIRTEKEGNVNNTVPSTLDSGKKVVKTLVFYDDFTFDTYLPNKQ